MVMVILTQAAGCAKQPADPAAGQTGAGATGSKPASVAENSTETQGRQFAESLQEQVRLRNPEAINAALDWDAILETAMAGIPAPEAVRQGFAKGFKSNLSSESGFSQQIVRQLGTGGSYRLLRVHSVDGRLRALFRLLSQDGAVNYHDFILTRRPDGTVRASDVHIFLSGELLSATLRRAYLPAAADASKGMLARLTGQESDYIKNLDRLKEISKAVAEGRDRDALKLYAGLPRSVQTDKNVLLMRLRAAQNVDEQEYAAVIAEFRSAHPGDAGLDLISLDGYFMKKQYNQVLRCLERLDTALGGDPYLDLMRANVSCELQKLDEARQLAQKAIDGDDSLQNAYFLLIGISLTAKDFDETSRLLSLMERRFDLRFDNLAGVTEYAEYTKSPQYQKWLESRPQAPQGPQPQP
jgi:hypothetical protein